MASMATVRSAPGRGRCARPAARRRAPRPPRHRRPRARAPGPRRCPRARQTPIAVIGIAIVSIAIASIAIASIAIASIAIVSIATANFKVEVGRHGQSALTCSSPCGRPPLQKTGRLRRAAPLRERHLPCVGAIRGSAAVPVCLPATLPPPHRLWSSRWAVPTTRLASGCSGQALSRHRRWRCCRVTSDHTTTRSMPCSRTVSSGERHSFEQGQIGPAPCRDSVYKPYRGWATRTNGAKTQAQMGLRHRHVRVARVWDS